MRLSKKKQHIVRDPSGRQPADLRDQTATARSTIRPASGGTPRFPRGTVALCWPAVVGFLRLATNRRVVVNPLSVEKATGIVDTWLRRPDVPSVGPDFRALGHPGQTAASHPGRRESGHGRPHRRLRRRARLHPLLERRRLRTFPGATLAEPDHDFPRSLTRWWGSDRNAPAAGSLRSGASGRR